MSILKRSITPIFNFKFDEEDIEFTFLGKYNDSDYSITLKNFGPISLAEINKLENEDSNWNLLLKYVGTLFNTPQRSIYFRGLTARYFLIVNVRHQKSVLLKDDELRIFEESPSSPQLHYITENFLHSLNLHSPKGISFERIYSFHIPFQKIENYQSEYNLPNIKLWAFEEPSILQQKKFEKCKKTFSDLLIKRELPKSTYKHFLFLALRYHQTTFNLEDFSHKFLILMIIFESLFKKEREKAGQAAKRISKFISKVQNNEEQIYNNFYKRDPESFCNIRNQIAHGDPNLDIELIKSRYPLLYKYITKAIIKYAGIPSGAINKDEDYYNEIDNYIKSYYDSLPSS